MKFKLGGEAPWLKALRYGWPVPSGVALMLAVGVEQEENAASIARAWGSIALSLVGCVGAVVWVVLHRRESRLRNEQPWAPPTVQSGPLSGWPMAGVPAPQVGARRRRRWWNKLTDSPRKMFALRAVGAWFLSGTSLGYVLGLLRDAGAFPRWISPVTNSLAGVALMPFTIVMGIVYLVIAIVAIGILYLVLSMVFDFSSGPFEHPTQAAAQAEADRLSEKEGRPFKVYPKGDKYVVGKA